MSDRQEIGAREYLELMVRTDQGSMTVWSADEVRQALDAYRADVLVEAEVEIRLATERNAAEYPDMESMVIRRQGMAAAERVVQGMREEVEEKSSPAGADATPEFFQPGHTYRSGRTIFLCEAVSTHPATGERRALGWVRQDGYFDEVQGLDPDDFVLGGWADVTGTEATR